MQCPFCGSDSQVLDSRTTTDAVRRRRICNSCKRRFTTYEKLGPPTLKVVKRSGKSESFDAAKIRVALTRVTRRRPVVKPADIDRVVRSIETELLAASAKSIRSGQIADLVLDRLAELDKLSYDRMAANYIDEDGRLRTDQTAPTNETPAQRELFGPDRG